jgi:hypothetical protein
MQFYYDIKGYNAINREFALLIFYKFTAWLKDTLVTRQK